MSQSRRGRLIGWGAAALGVAATAVSAQPSTSSATPGIVVEHIRASRAPTVRAGDRRITIVRVDLQRYRLRILTERRHGQRRPVPAWVRDRGLAGAINGGMFMPDGRSVGFMKQDGQVVSDRRVSRYHGAVAFGPVSGGAPLVVGGRGCPGETMADLRHGYDNVLQALAMIDCHGEPVRRRQPRRYSAAGFGIDRQGRAVFVHSRTPYRMTVLNRMLAAPELGIRGLIYMEGGPEASLVVQDGDIRVR